MFSTRRPYMTLSIVVFAMLLAGCPLNPPAHGFPGPYGHVMREMTYGDGYYLSVYTPDPALYSEKAPIIIFNPGWNQARGSYHEYGKQLAEWGFVVAIRFYPHTSLPFRGWEEVEIDLHQDVAHVMQVSEIIDWMVEQNADLDSPLHGRLDLDHIGTAGHSLGSKVTLDAALADPRIDAIVNLDGWFDKPGGTYVTGLPDTGVAIMWINADQGYCTLREDETLVEIYDYLPSHAADVLIHGAGHLDFFVLPSFQMQVLTFFCGAGNRDAAEVRSLALKYMISWFNVQLKGRPEFEDNYNGAAAAYDATHYDVEFRSK